MGNYFKLEPYPYEQIKMLEQGEAMFGGPESPLNIALQRIISRMEYLSGKSGDVKLRRLYSLPRNYDNYGKVLHPNPNSDEIYYINDTGYSRFHILKYNLSTNTWTYLFNNYNTNIRAQYLFINRARDRFIGVGGSTVHTSRNVLSADFTNLTLSITGDVNPALDRVYAGIVVEDPKETKDIFVFGPQHPVFSLRGRIAFKIDRDTGVATQIANLPRVNTLPNYYNYGAFINDNEILLPIRISSTVVSGYIYNIVSDTYTKIVDYTIPSYGSYGMMWFGSKLYYVDTYFTNFYNVSDDFMYLYRDPTQYPGSLLRNRCMSYIMGGNNVAFTPNVYERNAVYISV